MRSKYDFSQAKRVKDIPHLAKLQEQGGKTCIVQQVDDKGMLPEYDFSNGVRGKYAARYQQASNVVRLDDDVAAMFPSAEKVNEALRALGLLIRKNATS